MDQAQTTPRLSIVNSQFDTKYSSCSVYSPTTFKWSAGTDHGDAIVYCDRSIRDGNFAPKYDKKKIAWIVESPAIVPDVISYIKSNSKLISYSYDALYTCLDDLIGLEKNFYYCPSASNLPWIHCTKQVLYYKTKMTSMFASPKFYTDGHKLRHRLAKQYAGKVDVFGGANGTQRMGEGVHPDKLDGLKDYRFHIAVENTIADKYYTEKITDCFATGTIPIYWGTRKICEDFDANGIIFLDDHFDVSTLTRELYESKLESVKTNLSIVQKMQSADDSLYERIKTL